MDRVERRIVGGEVTVALIGPYSSPLGGVSVHVQRLAALLSAQFRVVVIDPYRAAGDRVGHQVIGCGPPGLWAVIRAAFIARAQSVQLVHIHVSSMARFIYGGHLLLRLLPGAARLVMTVHSGSFVPEFRAANPVARALICSLVRKCDLVIAVSAEIGAQLKSCGVSAERIAVLPAFIPPNAGDMPEDADRLLPPRFPDGRIIVASGYGISDYGFEVLLNALIQSDYLRSRCSVVICLYNTYEEEYVRELERLAKRLPRVVIYRDLAPEQFTRILSASDIYARPTTRDGDAVSVREAGHYGKQVIASDCVRRPVGCQLFRTGDAGSLADALRLLIDDESAGRITADSAVGAEYGDLYRRCIERSMAGASGLQGDKP